MKKREKIECPKCNKLIDISNFEKHVNGKTTHDYRKERKTDSWRLLDGSYACPYCKKVSTKYGICAHIFLMHSEEGKSHLETIHTGMTAWNKNLSKENSDSLKKQSEKLTATNLKKAKEGKNGFQIYARNNPQGHRLHGSMGGGLRKMSGKGHRGWYKGYYCQSSWELAFVIYNIEHNIKFARNTKCFHYIFEGKERKYFPDFQLEDGTFVEIKGYEDNKSIAKKDQFKEKLIVLKRADMKTYFDYVKAKHGNSFTYLYENHGPVAQTVRAIA